MYCDIVTPIEDYLTRVMIISIVSAIVFSLTFTMVFGFSFLLMLLIIFFLTQIIVHSWLSLSADGRAKFVEDLLPDLLQLMASNLRAGHTIDKALLLSARPEFGKFKDEINRLGKDVATGTDFGDALFKLSKRVKSDKLTKAVQLIVAGQKSGGGLVDLLSQSASNLRQQRTIDERIRSNVFVYVIFIFAAIGFGAPILFSLSSFLIEVMKDIFSQIEIPAAAENVNIPISFSEIKLDPKFVMQYTIVSMLTTSVLGSMVLGLISKGKRKAGLKFIPILCVMTIAIYFIVKGLISGLLGGLFNL
tara:strand:- start:75 stop:986 length:912 start_codon:yes stop_codon:yes gene_type:complete